VQYSWLSRQQERGERIENLIIPDMEDGGSPYSGGCDGGSPHAGYCNGVLGLCSQNTALQGYFGSDLTSGYDSLGLEWSHVLGLGQLVS
jgi:hypothetical protein